MRMQEVPGQAGGGSFEIETPIAYRAKECAFCASQQQSFYF